MTADNITTAPNRTDRTIIAPAAAVELLDSLATDTSETDTETKPDRFHITDKSGLQWYASKIAAIRAERDQIKAQAAKMIAALDADESSLKGLYEAEAQETTARLLAEGGNKRKSVETWHGTFGFRTVPGGYAVTDTDAALPHAHALGCTKTTVATDAYLQAATAKLEETGELLPGISKVEDRESFGLHLPTKKKGGIVTQEDLSE